MADSSEGMTDFDSNLIKAYGYDPDTRALRIRFPSGAVHEYADVPAEKVETMLGNSSPGAYFNEKIKGVHLSTKISP